MLCWGTTSFGYESALFEICRKVICSHPIAMILTPFTPSYMYSWNALDFEAAIIGRIVSCHVMNSNNTSISPPAMFR